MLETNVKVINNDLNTLIKDAQALFQAAATLTGEKADEMRNRGMVLLNTAQDKAQKLQAGAIAAGKDAAVAANGYVKENPWRAVAAAGGLGLLMGVIIARK
jgi:ElaB/YqjD/DUF883 family membrane-anchored ribosome-binding protein